MMYDTDQCHIHLNSLWFVCVWGGGVFPYDALCGLFWWDCALRVYTTSYLVNVYHVSAQGVDGRMINVHNCYHYILIIYIKNNNYIYITRKITYL